MSKDIRQIKLSNGDEIICEVLLWNNEETDAILARHAYIIVTVENAELGMRYFTFRPWMTYMDDPSKVLNLNSALIVGECIPTGLLFDNYTLTVDNAYKDTTPDDKDMLDKLYQDAMDLMAGTDSAEPQNNNGFYVEDEAHKIH